MDLWIKDGELRLKNGDLVICANCPCGGCDSCASSYFVEFTATGTPGTATVVTVPDPGCPGLTGASTCFWSGTISGGVFAGMTALVHGIPNSGSWTVHVVTGSCTGVFAGLFDGTGAVACANNTPYTNGVVVT